MTIRKVLQVTCSTFLIFCVLICSPTLIGAASVVAPIRVGLQKTRICGCFVAPISVGLQHL